jgi:D-serine deaminase-like pyridoxal phosphate-dependent protein
MGIKAKFTMKDIEHGHQAAIAEVHERIVQGLAAVGEFAIGLARDEHAKNYTDQTGNLRASIGYVLSYDGDVIFEAGFDPNAAKDTKKQRDGVTGAAEGRQLAVEIAKQRGYTLVVVAGMNYGVYVEKRNYDVLTFTEAQARIMANNLVKQIFKTT